MRFIVAMTGASGQIYAQRLLQKLVAARHNVMLVVTEAACISLAAETGVKVTPHSTDISKLLGFSKSHPTSRSQEEEFFDTPQSNRVLDEGAKYVQSFNPRDVGAPPASGSNRHDGMIVVPCSMGTLGRIVHGTSDDLICRAADVTLKERRKLILVTREMPLSLVHLKNMQAAHEAGALVCHACPHFYHAPQTVEEVVDTVIDRVLDHLNVESKTQRWRADELTDGSEQEAE